MEGEWEGSYKEFDCNNSLTKSCKTHTTIKINYFQHATKDNMKKVWHETREVIDLITNEKITQDRFIGIDFLSEEYIVTNPEYKENFMVVNTEKNINLFFMKYNLLDNFKSSTIYTNVFDFETKRHDLEYVYDNCFLVKRIECLENKIL